MPWAYLVFIFGVVWFAIVAYGSFADGKNWLGALSLVMLVLTVVSVLSNANGINSRTNNMYSAASQQGIAITTTWWSLTPITTTPCRVELEHKKEGKVNWLILPASGNLVTPEMLAAVCK